MAIRQQVLEEHPSFRMVGVNFICPESTIKKLCSEAQFAANADDFSVHIRPELKEKFFSVIFGSSS